MTFIQLSVFLTIVRSKHRVLRQEEQRASIGPEGALAELALVVGDKTNSLSFSDAVVSSVCLDAVPRGLIFQRLPAMSVVDCGDQLVRYPSCYWHWLAYWHNSLLPLLQIVVAVLGHLVDSCH
jgi:hypothetical protein